MTDRFRPLSLEMMKEIFPSELAYIRKHAFAFMENMPEYLTLLQENRLSHWHVWNIRQRLDEEAKALEEQRKKETANLTASHRAY